MTFIDMFCGIGTIRMGFEQAGHECVYSIEWDKHKRRIYNVIFGKEPEGQDIREISADELPRSDCWCFGFPCQDISVAGKQLGFNGDRSSLFFEVMRLLQETKEEDKPRYLFVENVKNLFSVNKGWDFFNLLYSLDEGGYDAEWQLLNSKDYGVAQNRERVFVIGHLRGRSTRKVFPIRGNDTKINIKQIGNCMPTKTRDNPNQGRIYDVSGISPGLNKMEGGGRQPFIQVRAVIDVNRISKSQNGRRFKEAGEPMFALTKQDVHGVMITNPNEVKRLNSKDKKRKTASSTRSYIQHRWSNEGRLRRLTPKECWRLQGIPDEITDKVIAAGISDTQMYRGAGDATTVNVIYKIAKRM